MTVQNQPYPLDRAHPPVDGVRAPLDSTAYFSVEQHAREVDKLYREQWLFVGPAAMFATANSAHPIEIAGLDLLVTCDGDGELRGFFNVCAQRLRPQATLLGLDLSPEMAYAAEQTGAYDRVLGNINLLKPDLADDADLPPADHVICCGTLTNGHVGTEGVSALLDLTAPGGQVTFSVRLNHSREHDFNGEVQRLADAGTATLISALYNAPYIEEEGADYFTLRKEPAAA